MKKMVTLSLAALMSTATLGMAAPAAAQPGYYNGGYDAYSASYDRDHRRYDRYDRRGDRYDRRDYRNDRRYYQGSRRNYRQCDNGTGGTVIGGMAAHCFARYRFRFRTLLYFVIFSTIIFPPQVTVIGLFQIMVEYGLYDSRIGLVLVYSVPIAGAFLGFVDPGQDVAVLIALTAGACIVLIEVVRIVHRRLLVLPWFRTPLRPRRSRRSGA